jgi:transcriptional regulator with XRE-family HTH domain
VLRPPSPIGGFVRERRRARGLSQRELAEIARVGPNFVSQLETGRPGLRMDGVNRVLAIFGKRLGIEDLPRDGSDR